MRWMKDASVLRHCWERSRVFRDPGRLEQQGQKLDGRRDRSECKQKLGLRQS